MKIPAILAALALSACTSTGALTPQAATIAADTAEAGQLFCQYGPTLMAVAGVNVVGASSEAVAQACAVAKVIGALLPPAITPAPVAAPAGAQAVLAAVPNAVAATVALSAIIRGGKG